MWGSALKEKKESTGRGERSMGWGPSPRYLHPHRCTEKGGLLEACRGDHEVTGETFPGRQAGGQTTRAFSGLQFSDNREALRDFRQRNVHMGVFSGEVTRVAEKGEGEWSGHGGCHCLSPSPGVKELEGSRMRKNRGTLEAKCEVNKNTLFNQTLKAATPLQWRPKLAF